MTRSTTSFEENFRREFEAQIARNLEDALEREEQFSRGFERQFQENYQSTMKQVVTIGGGSGQSNLLNGLSKKVILRWLLIWSLYRVLCIRKLH